MAGKTVIFDIETHSAKLLYTLPPEEFVRLIGWKFWGEPEVFLTEDLEEIREVLRSARGIIGHNIHSFDLPAVFGIRSDEPLQMAIGRKVFDTWTHAVLVNPAPFQYINRLGKGAKGDKPEALKKWFSLDEQAHQLGVPGKTHDLKELAKEFGDPDLPLKERIDDGFGRIPKDDPRYREYLIGDVNASERVATALLKRGKLDAYAYREQEIEARKFVIQVNGFRLDVPKAQARVDELAARREVIMTDLVERYGLPSTGDAPWDTNAGKKAILAALADHEIKPSDRWPKTPVWDKKSEKLREVKQKIHTLKEKVAGWRAEVEAGELPDRSIKARERWIEKTSAEIAELEEQPLPPWFGLSFGGSELIELTKDTPAAELGRALAELKGQRSLAQLALDSLHPDGFVHPDITMLQRSGRWSTTEPGLTVWTSRGEGAVEKSYFIPDSDDHVLLAFDYSNADSRIVAAYSGDKKYAERFEPGADGHLINAWAAWGKEKVGTNKEDPTTAHYRFKAKALGHGWNYGGQYKTLATQAGLPLEDSKQFCDGMNSTFRVLISWQNKVRKLSQVGYVINDWGRKMWVEKGREFTQAPALMGQSGTREIMCDGLLAMPIEILRMVKAQIHDELIFSVPKDNWEYWRDRILECMTPKNGFKPKQGGQLIDFPVSAGEPGANWQEATH